MFLVDLKHRRSKNTHPWHSKYRTNMVLNRVSIKTTVYYLRVIYKPRPNDPESESPGVSLCTTRSGQSLRSYGLLRKMFESEPIVRVSAVKGRARSTMTFGDSSVTERCSSLLVGRNTPTWASRTNSWAEKKKGKGRDKGSDRVPE